jgi:hypothetical protein
MDIRGPVKNLALALMIAVLIISILCYAAAGVYFFADGLRLQSGGGILLGLACWGGVALFSLPLWCLFAIRVYSKVLEQQNTQMKNAIETIRDDSRFREISRAMSVKDTELYD